MIFVDNDFYSNFNSIKKANDDVSMTSLFIDQISNIIAFKKGELIDLFDKSSIKHSDNPNNKELTDLVVNNLGSNKKLVIGIAYLIAKENDILQEQLKKNRDKYSNVNDKKEKKGVNWATSLDSIQALAGSLAVVSDSLTGVKKGHFADDILGQTETKNPSAEELALAKQQELDANKNKNKWIWLVVGLVVVAGVGYMGYKKGWFSKEATPVNV